MPGLTNERADELVAEAHDFTAMLAAAEAAFADLYQPLGDTQKNDVPVRAAVLALAARRKALADAGAVGAIIEAAQRRHALMADDPAGSATPEPDRPAALVRYLRGLHRTRESAAEDGHRWTEPDPLAREAADMLEGLVRQRDRMRRALEGFAKIELPREDCPDGTWVAKTLHCNDMVTAALARLIWAALA
jgi:hypothetical protein